MLGQLRSASFVDVAPSVIESPKATMAAAFAGAMTSTPEIQYHDRVVAASVSIGCAVTLPLAIYVVCSPVACVVSWPLSPGTYTLIERSPSCGTCRSIGSLVISAPAGIVTLGFPLNMRVRSEPVAIPDSLLRSATCAAPIISGALPNAFERATRARRPPMLVRTIMRTVWSLNALGAGFAAGAAGAAPARWPSGA